MIFQLEFSAKLSNHAGQIQIGIFVNGCVKAVPSVVAAVDETVAAVKRPGQQSANGTEAIALCYADVVFANKDAVMKISSPRISIQNKTFHFVLLLRSHGIQVESIEHIFGV